MRIKRKFLIAGVACALPLVAVAAWKAGAADTVTPVNAADTVTPVVGLSTFHQMVADTSASAGSGYLFLSGDGGIAVTDLTGKSITTLDPGDSVAGLALSADGSTLYAAVTSGTDAHSVAAISVSTIASTATLAQAFYQLIPAPTPAPTDSGTPTPTDTGSGTPTDTGSATPTDTGSGTPTDTGSATPTDTGSATPTDTGSATPTDTGSATSTVSATLTAATSTYVPYSLALQSGKLWVSYTDTSVATDPGAIGDITLSAGTGSAGTVPAGTFEPGTATGAWAAAPDIAADPSATGSTLVAVLGSSGSAASYDTSATAPITPTAGPAVLSACSSAANQVAVVPGGTQFILACGSAANAQVYSTTDFSPVTTTNYPTTVAAGGVALNTDGAVAVGTSASPSVIDVYKADGTLLNVLGLGDPLAGAHSLAWFDTTSGAVLAAVVQPSSTAYSVDVLSQPEVTRARLALTASAQPIAGRALTLSGTLTLSTGGQLPTGQTVTITRTGPGGTATLNPVAVTNGSFSATDTPPATGSYTYSASYAGVPSSVTAASVTTTVAARANTSKLAVFGPVTNAVGKSLTIRGSLLFGAGSVPANTRVTVTRTAAGLTKKVFTVGTTAGGAFQITDNPTSARSYTYTAAYAGTAAIATATASHVVTEVRTTPSLSLATGTTTANYLATLTITAHLGTSFNYHTVKIYARQAGSQGAALIKTGTVNAAGNLSVRYTVRLNTTFSVVFTGDARYLPRAVARVVGVRAAVAMRLTGNYGTARSGSTTYLLYHRSGRVNIAASVVPNKHGQCVRVEVQEFLRGSWQPNATTACRFLTSSSQVSNFLTVATADLGFPYRIRADYVASSGSSNLSSDSSWQYIMVKP